VLVEQAEEGLLGAKCVSKYSKTVKHLVTVNREVAYEARCLHLLYIVGNMLHTFSVKWAFFF